MCRTAERIVLVERPGRIAGIYHPKSGLANLPGAMLKLLAGRGSALQSAGVVADYDACSLDGARIANWQSALMRLAEIDGAFALASFDGRQLLLAADPSGHRSMYYYVASDQTIIFASQLHLLLASGLVPRRLHIGMVPFFLSFAYLPGPETLVEGVRVLPAGSALRADSSGVAISPFWRLPAESTSFKSEEILRVALRSTLEAAVQRALPEPDAPVGAFLSGGVDSSLVLALMGQLHPGPLRSWSVAFGPGHANELAFSEAVARHCNCPQEVVEILPEHIRADFDRTVHALSEPNGDPLTVPNFRMFARAAETGIVLNGEGGDPCFGGPKNAPMLLAELLGDGDEDGDAFFRERCYLRAHLKCYDELPHMLNPELAESLASHPLEKFVQGWFEDERWSSYLNRLIAVNIAFKGAHHILPKVDHLGAPFGVCARSPLFDRRVVDFSFQIPAQLKRNGAIEKYLLKAAVRDLLPAQIIDRPKSGMMVPVEAWFQGPLLGWAKERLLDSLASYNVIRKPWMEALLAGKLGGLRPRRGVKIWLLLTLESWLRGAGMEKA